MTTQTKRREKGLRAKAVDKKTLERIVGRLRSRTSTLAQERTSLGFAGNGPLRRLLLAHLGSAEAYRKVVALGRQKGKGNKGTKSE